MIEGPMTGANSDLGAEFCNGSKLAAQTGIIKGPMAGAKLVIDCVDNPTFDVNVSVTDATRFVSDPSVWTMGGFGISANTQAAAQVAAKAGLDITSSGGAADFLTDTGAGNVWVDFPRVSAFGAATVDFCHRYYGATVVASLHPDYSYLAPALASGKLQAANLQMTWNVDLAYQPGITDFSSLLTKLKAANAGCNFLSEFAPTEAQQVVQARQLGLKAPLEDFAGGGGTPDAYKVGGQSLVGFVWTTDIDPNLDPNSLLGQAIASYAKTFGGAMDVNGAYAYDDVLAIKSAIEAGATTRQDLGKYMAMVDTPGLTGQLKYDAKKRIGDRVTYFLEQTDAQGTQQKVATYDIHDDGAVDLVSISQCSTRPTCALNISH